MRSETRRIAELSDEQILRDVELQQRAEKAWSNAWDRARRADEKAGRPYNRHTYADAAHRAHVKVTGVCRHNACAAHPRKTRIEFHDAGADNLGRRHYTLHWIDEHGEFRPQLHPDGQPVGLRRAQGFFGVPPLGRR